MSKNFVDLGMEFIYEKMTTYKIVSPRKSFSQWEFFLYGSSYIANTTYPFLWQLNKFGSALNMLRKLQECFSHLLYILRCWKPQVNFQYPNLCKLKYLSSAFAIDCYNYFFHKTVSLRYVQNVFQAWVYA